MAKRLHEFVWTSQEEFDEREWLVLWCDKKHHAAILGVRGISGFIARTSKCCSIGFDPRYDTNETVGQIEAIIMEGTE